MSEMHAQDQEHSNPSQMQNINQITKQQSGGFTDLTNQFAVNITNVNKQRAAGPGNPGNNANQPPLGSGSYQSVRVGVQPSLAPLPNANMRGYSRGSKQSQKSQRNSGLNQLYQSQPSTANSKKRGATVVHQSINNNLNILGSGVGNVEALPPNHQPHLSPLQNPPLVNAQRTVPQGLHQKSGALLPLNGRPEPPMQFDYKVDEQEQPLQIQQKFSKQIQGVGGLKMLNEGLLAQEQNAAMMSSYTNMKSELSVKDGMLQDNETNSINAAANNNKYAMKSRSNITLLQNQAEHSSIVPEAMASSKLANGNNYQMKMPASANANQASGGNFMQKRISNSGTNNGATEESKTSRFAMNYMAKEDQQNGVGAQQTLPNIKLNSENYGQGLQKDQNQSSRKMSLAAKSGQMQVFNNLHSQNLNQVASRSEGQSLMASGHQNGGMTSYDGIHNQQASNMAPIPKANKPSATMTNNMGAKHQLPPHPSSSAVSHKPPSTLNPNAVIGAGHGTSTSAASGNANGGSLQSQINVPSSAHSKHSAANQQQKAGGLQPVPMQTVVLNVNGGSTAQTSEQNETGGITHGSLALQSQSHSAQPSAQSSAKSANNAAGMPTAPINGSNCQSTTGNYQTPLGSRQFESYLGRKQIIQQQREKKQELLKQLDMGQVGKAGAVNAAPNTVTNGGEPRRTLTDGQESLRPEGLLEQAAALRVDGATMGHENSSAQGIPRRMQMANNHLIPANHGQSNSIAVQPTQFDGFQASEIKLYQHGQGAHCSSISPSRGSRQFNPPQQLHPRGPNPLGEGTGGPSPTVHNQHAGVQMTQSQALNSGLNSFDQVGNPQAKRRFKSNAHAVAAGGGSIPGSSGASNQYQQNAAYQNQNGNGGVPVLGQQQQEFSQYLQQQLSPLNMVSQQSEGANRLQFQAQASSGSAAAQDQIQGVGITGNAIGLSSNIRNLNCMQNGQPGGSSSQHQSKLENKQHKQRSESIKYDPASAAGPGVLQDQRETVHQQDIVHQQQVHQAAINSRITRKLEGGRPHKVYDYMFIQMSMEQFIKEYAGRKILIMNNESKKDGAQGGGAEANAAAHHANKGNFSSINHPHHNLGHHHLNQGSVSPRGGLIYQSQLEQQMTDKNNKKNFLSPNKTPDKNGKMFGIGALQSPNSLGLSSEPLDLNGLVKIKAYESQVTDEIPQVQCNLQPTQLDHLKVLVCEQEDKFHPKLTPDAANRFEIEKQNQIKQYMEDIIAKLQQKERRFKVTVKKKFVEDALFNSTQIRVASVYVIVINREKTYDPLLNQKFFKSRKRMSNNRNGSGPIESSSEEEDLQHLDPQSREEYLKQQRLIKEQLRRSANPNLVNAKKRSLYDSDANGNGLATDNMNSTSTSSNMPHFKKLMQDKSISTNLNGNGKLIKPKKGISTGPNFKRPFRKDDEFTAAYKYTPPVKEFKYGPTKIRITQDPNEHSHHFKHPFNVYSHQYNEFIRLVLKNQKLTTQSSSANTGPVYKFNYNYAVGLAKALGMNLRKEAFSEQNMKSREHVNQLKEKLIFCFWKKIIESNKDLTPNVGGNNCQGSIEGSSALGNREVTTDVDAIADGETVDSSNCNNTPKSKNLKLNRESSQSVDQTGGPGNSNQTSQHLAHHAGQSNALVYPPPNIIYKYVIGKGNNSIMVRSLFKNRFWWVQHDREEMEKCQYCWTQIRKVPIMEALPCKYPNRRSGLKNVSYSNNQVSNQSMQQILTTPQQKSSKKAKKATQGSEKNSTNSKNMNDSVMQSTIQQPHNNNAAAVSSAYAETLKFTETKLYNKIEDNFHVNNKKALFLNMKNYYEAMGVDVFENIPLTFHVKTGLDDPEFQRFKQYYFKFEEDMKNKKAAAKQRRKEAQELKDKQVRGEGEDAQSPQQAASSPDKKKDADEPQYYQSPAPPKNIWIIKPGENTNRGHGIQVAKEFDEIKSIVEDATTNGRRTCIVQKYIHNPLLIHRRKFDIRTYVLCTTVNGNMKVYIYEEGYLRTSCREYVLGSFQNKLIHLTNDAVQKRSEDYGKFEPGNKLSYNEFQMYLDKTYPDLNICFERDLKPQMNKLTTDIFRACYNKIDPKRRLNCMEVFGLDFMFDDEFRPYTIEVNTNPCLELVSPLLARLIPNMLENALKIALDTQFLPPESFSTKKAFIGDPCPENRFELVFDSNIDNPVLEKLFKEKADIIIEMDEDELSEEEEHDDEE